MLADLAATGFVLSLIVHVATSLGGRTPLGEWTMMLHAGVFVVGIASWAACRACSPAIDAGDRVFDVLYRSPTWAKIACAALFAYALGHSHAFHPQLPAPKGFGGPPMFEEPPPVVCRIFSAVWMALYALAAMLLSSARRLTHAEDAGEEMDGEPDATVREHADSD